MRLGTAQRRSNAPGIAPARLSLAEKPSFYPHPIPVSRRPPSRDLSHAILTFYHPISCTGERGEGGGWSGGVVGVRRAGVGPVEWPFRPAGGAHGALRGVGRRANMFCLILRFLRMLWAVACASRVAQTFCYTRVCVLWVSRAAFFGPPDPLIAVPPIVNKMHFSTS